VAPCSRARVTNDTRSAWRSTLRPARPGDPSAPAASVEGAEQVVAPGRVGSGERRCDRARTQLAGQRPCGGLLWPRGRRRGASSARRASVESMSSLSGTSRDLWLLAVAARTVSVRRWKVHVVEHPGWPTRACGGPCSSAAATAGADMRAVCKQRLHFAGSMSDALWPVSRAAAVAATPGDCCRCAPGHGHVQQVIQVADLLVDRAWVTPWSSRHWRNPRTYGRSNSRTDVTCGTCCTRPLRPSR